MKGDERTQKFARMLDVLVFTAHKDGVDWSELYMVMEQEQLGVLRHHVLGEE